MAADAAAVRAPAPAATRRLPVAEALGGGFIVGYLSLVVLLPLAALVAEAGNFRHAVTNREAVAALELTLVLALAVALVNAVIGTATAWVLVRDDFRGKRLVNAVIDLPFALPTIVAGLTLLALYGPRGWTGLNLAFTRAGVLLALLFVTLPFVVRSVQPVLLELDAEMEEAAASLGARPAGDLPADRLPEPAAGGPLRRRARVRARGRRVRLGRADLGQPAVQDRGRVRLHLRADPVERRGGRGVAVARAARDLVRRRCSLIGAVRRWATRHDRQA